jgi:hypothetical protein
MCWLRNEDEKHRQPKIERYRIKFNANEQYYFGRIPLSSNTQNYITVGTSQEN